MDDARFVGGLDAGGDLDGEFEGFVQRQGAAVKSVGEGFAFDVFQNQILGPVLLLDAVDASQVDVAQGGEGLGLALEPFEADGILGEELREFLDGDVPVQRGSQSFATWLDSGG